MTGILHTYIPQRVIDSNGIADGASMAFYATGTLTPATIYSDAGLTTPRANPVVVGAGAEVPAIYLDPAVTYRRIITYSDGSTDDLDPWMGLTFNSGALFHTPDLPSGEPRELSELLNTGVYTNALSFFTDAQVTDVTGHTGAIDVTVELQAAINETWAANRSLYLPAGRYKVTGLTLPGDAANRNRAWKMIGQGLGELFARGFNNGTIIESSTNAPIITNAPDVVPAGVGTFEIAHIRFEQTNAAATAPVVWFKSMYGPCNFHDNGVYQAGTGIGMRTDFTATTTIRDLYILGPNWTGVGSGAAGSIGLHCRNVNDAGLLTIEKVTSRGFETAFKIGDTDPTYDGQVISTAIRDCESSYCETGIELTNAARSTVIDNFYCEGGLGGTGVAVGGQFTTIQNSQFFFGFSKVITVAAAARGTVISGNIISLGNAQSAAPNPIGIEIAGGINRVLVSGGFIVHDPDSFGPVANAIGIKILGDNPAVDIVGVDFNPATPWSAVNGAYKVHTSGVTGSVNGMILGTRAGVEVPIFQGALQLSDAPTIAALSQAISNPPTQAEVQAISNKIDELLAALRTAGIVS